MRAAILGAPESAVRAIESEFGNTPLAFDSKLSRKSYDYIHLFTKSRVELTREFPSLKNHLDADGMLWISWPKKASKIETDLDENIVREIGLKAGLVDVKVCAVDEIWSGLKLTPRKSVG